MTTLTISTSVAALDDQAFADCPSISIVLIKPNTDGDDNGGDGNGDGDTAEAAAISSAFVVPAAIIAAFTERTKLPNDARIWATDDVISGLQGRFAGCNRFEDVPRALRAAPDAKTWAGVQLWLWWLPPLAFCGSSGGVLDGRIVCRSRIITVWNTMVSGFRAQRLAILPYLPPELWLRMFEFLRHDQQPAFPVQGGGSKAVVYWNQNGGGSEQSGNDSDDNDSDDDDASHHPFFSEQDYLEKDSEELAKQLDPDYLEEDSEEEDPFGYETDDCDCSYGSPELGCRLCDTQ